MNDIDTIMRETLENYAGRVTPGPDLFAGALHRSRTIRRRRMVTAGALTVTALGVASFAAAAAISGTGQTDRNPRAQIGSSPSADASPVASPTPSARFAARCPDGQVPELTQTGTASAIGNVEVNQGALPATQLLLQGYLRAVSNQQAIDDYGVGVDSATQHGVVWVKFQTGSTVEIVPNGTDTTWSAYPASVGPCTGR